jgi:hypothetical protein
MMRGNPQLQAIALLVRKFGKRIPGGGYEVEITHQEMMEMSQWGMFQEVPELDLHKVRWQYYPNNTIEGEVVTPESVTPSGVDPVYIQDHLTPEQKEEYLKHLQDPNAGPDDGCTT